MNSVTPGERREVAKSLRYLGYVLEERNGTIHFFESKNELVEFVANELDQQSIEMYATETIERADGSHIRWYFYRQSGSEVVRDEA